MNVAMILNSFPEISEKFLLNHIIGLLEADVDLDIYPAHRPLSDKRHDIYDQFRVGDHVRYVDVPRARPARVARLPLLFLRLFVRSPKAAIEALRFGKYRTVALNGKLLYFGLAFAGKRYDIVHCHFGVNGLIGAYLKECGFCDRLITAFHGSDINTYPKKHGADVYRTLYATADKITANTSFIKGKIVANGCAADLIGIVPETLIAADYADVQRTAVERHSVLTVGRLEEKKGHAYALEAIALVRKEIPDVRYYVAGAGSLEGALKEKARDLGLEDRVQFLGLCTNTEIKKLYARCAVFTLPSVTASNGDMEGQGLVLQEAQICGLPVVTTIHNGIPDGVLADESGFLVPEKDVQALADRLTLLLKDEERGAAMGARGKAFVAAKYDIGPVTDHLMTMYRDMHAAR